MNKKCYNLLLSANLTNFNHTDTQKVHINEIKNVRCSGCSIICPITFTFINTNTHKMHIRSELYYMKPYVKIENIQVGLNKQAPESTVVQKIIALAKAAGPGELLI